MNMYHAVFTAYFSHLRPLFLWSVGFSFDNYFNWKVVSLRLYEK